MCFVVWIPHEHQSIEPIRMIHRLMVIDMRCSIWAAQHSAKRSIPSLHCIKWIFVYCGLLSNGKMNGRVYHFQEVHSLIIQFRANCLSKLQAFWFFVTPWNYAHKRGCFWDRLGEGHSMMNQLQHFGWNLRSKWKVVLCDAAVPLLTSL